MSNFITELPIIITWEFLVILVYRTFVRLYKTLESFHPCPWYPKGAMWAGTIYKHQMFRITSLFPCALTCQHTCIIAHKKLLFFGAFTR